MDPVKPAIVQTSSFAVGNETPAAASPPAPDAGDAKESDVQPQGLPRKYKAAPKQNALLTSDTSSQQKRAERDRVLAAVKEDGSLLQYADPSLKDDPEIVLAAIENEGWALSHAGPTCRKDPAIVLAAIHKDWNTLQFADPSLRDDPAIILAAIAVSPDAFWFAGPRCQNDPAIALAAVKKNGTLLSYASEARRDDPAIVLAAVRNKGKALEYAGPRCKNDPAIVLAAVEQDARAFEFAGPRSRGDRAVALAAVKKLGSNLEYASAALRDNPAIVLAAIEQDANAFKHAGPTCRGNPEIVLAAVKKEGWNLEYASAALRDNPAIVLAAIEEDAWAFAFAGPRSRGKPDVVLAAVKKLGSNLEYASAALQDDPAIVLAAIEEDARALEFAGPTCRDTPEIVRAAFARGHISLRHAGPRCRDLRDIVLSRVSSDGLELRFAGDTMRRDRDVVLAAVRNKAEALEWADDSLKDDRAFVLAAVRLNGLALSRAGQYRSDHEIILAAVEQNGHALQFVDRNFPVTQEILIAAAMNNPSVLLMFDESVRTNPNIILPLIYRLGGSVNNAHHRDLFEKQVIEFDAVRKNSHARPGMGQRIVLRSFDRFFPLPPKSPQAFDDPLIRDYFTRHGTTEAMLEEADGKPLNRKEPEIENEAAFKADVLRVAEELGYTAKSISSLSIHNAIMLCGEIVTRRMHYEKGMIGQEEQAFFSQGKLRALEKLLEAEAAGQTIDLRNELAREIDGMPIDRLFAGGRGICRNYAPLNAAVFRIIKELNPGLRDTFMVVASPNRSDHHLEHAWNMVATLHDGDIEVTYVDPTWFNTRKRKPVDLGNSTLVPVNAEENYNALDESHFGASLYWSRIYLGDIYLAASRARRTQSAVVEALQPTYRQEAFRWFISAVEGVIVNAEGDPAAGESLQRKRQAAFFLMKTVVQELMLDGAEVIHLEGDELFGARWWEQSFADPQEIFRRLAVLKETILKRSPELMNETIGSVAPDDPASGLPAGAGRIIALTLKEVFDLIGKNSRNLPGGPPASGTAELFIKSAPVRERNGRGERFGERIEDLLKRRDQRR